MTPDPLVPSGPLVASEPVVPPAAPEPVTSSFAPPLGPVAPTPVAPAPVEMPLPTFTAASPGAEEPVVAPGLLSNSPVVPVATVPEARRDSPPSPTIAPPAQPTGQLRPQTAAATNPLLQMLAGAVLACGLVAFGVVLGHGTAPSSDSVLTGGAYTGNADNRNNPIVQAVKRVGPAVMNVDTTFGTAPSSFLPAPGEDGPREGKGTGVVIDSARGLMLTNAHVVANAAKIQVTNREGRQYTGKVLGFDRQSDIAVVELSNKHLPQARLATFTDPKQLDIGEWCIAIGNPFAQENTVTVGVLSAVGRTLPVPSNEGEHGFALTDMLQTDAAINPGNSGGPLCNIRGEVIGINTAIIPFGQGLGFSIPINKAEKVAEEIIRTGHVTHPYIGVMVKPVTDALKTDLGLPDKSGALVQNVEPNSPAAAAGLKAGDLIRKVNGVTMANNDDVVKAIGDAKVGEPVHIEILRNNAVKQTVTVKVADRPN